MAGKNVTEAMELPVTRSGIGKMVSGDQTYGEDGRVGSTYAAILQNRENLAGLRNRGPTAPKVAVGSVPMTNQMSRKTGKIA